MKTWIPEKNEVVLWNKALWKVLAVNMGGKCTLKQIPLSRKIGKVVKDVDLSELSKILIKPTKERNGVEVRKTRNDVNSCELRKISISGRDNGYICSVNWSGAMVQTGLSHRGKIVCSPIPDSELLDLVQDHIEKIRSIINQ